MLPHAATPAAAVRPRRRRSKRGPVPNAAAYGRPGSAQNQSICMQPHHKLGRDFKHKYSAGRAGFSAVHDGLRSWADSQRVFSARVQLTSRW